MLQQTRVETVLPYYDAFLKRFPDVATLASAPEAEVLALWSGLGYYSRARNLHQAAQQIAALDAFPNDHNALLALPGVGDYTAAAVASIAFELPFAAVDGNVLRVLARVHNDDGDIGSPLTRRRFRELAQANLDPRHPGEFNQAMMELGATICVPRNPRCLLCPVRPLCGAHAAGRTAELPIKVKRQGGRSETISIVAIFRDDLVLLRQRPGSAPRMAGFWELPHLEDVTGVRTPVAQGGFRHTIVNTLYEVQVYTATLRRAPAGMHWKNAEQEDIPITTITRKALQLIADSARCTLAAGAATPPNPRRKY
jgi:A/G-specific adenine glycosylase